LDWPRRRLDLRCSGSLHRINHNCAGLDSLDLAKEVLQVGLRQQQKIWRVDAEPLAAKLYLPLRFFAGNIKYGNIISAEFVGHLKQQGALADARIAAEQDERARNNSAA